VILHLVVEEFDVRTSARKTGTAAAAAAAALLLLAGCGGGSGDGGKPSPSAAGGGTHTAGSDDGPTDGGDTGAKGSGGGAGGGSGGDSGGGSGEDGGTGGGSDGGDSGLEPQNLSGGWTTAPEGSSDKVVFLIVSGEQAVVAAGTGSCNGTVARDADPVTFDLKCQGGADDYTKGTVKSHKGKKLVIAWESGKKTTFTKGGGPDAFPTPSAFPQT
jgi:hypothetical protein